jgi:hypothetical protein
VREAYGYPPIPMQPPGEGWLDNPWDSSDDITSDEEIFYSNNREVYGLPTMYQRGVVDITGPEMDLAESMLEDWSDTLREERGLWGAIDTPEYWQKVGITSDQALEAPEPYDGIPMIGEGVKPFKFIADFFIKHPHDRHKPWLLPPSQEE